MTSQFDDVIINEMKTCDWFTADDIIKSSDVTDTCTPADCCQDIIQFSNNNNILIKITFKMDINQNFEWAKY